MFAAGADAGPVVVGSSNRTLAVMHAIAGTPAGLLVGRAAIAVRTPVGRVAAAQVPGDEPTLFRDTVEFAVSRAVAAESDGEVVVAGELVALFDVAASVLPATATATVSVTVRRR
ncbi:MAG: hypothetical protein JOS17DRAFT_792609 [Linnemannia elongata]|nr:MAG: hypothetical protein JOS17DRAFT_792609 [Linnemannia elongata]